MVTPELFRKHVEWLGEEMQIVRLADWIDAARAGRPLPPRACAITFDDGWRDNFEHALPVLQQLGAPATIFVVSALIGTNRSFWPNQLMASVRWAGHRAGEIPEFQWLAPLAPVTLSQLHRSTEDLAATLVACKALPEDVVVQRVGQMVQSLHDRVGSQEDPQELEPEYRQLLDWSELARMVESGVFDVGSHTRHHCKLTDALSTEQLDEEIRRSKLEIESALGIRVPLFCYPYGASCERARDTAAREYTASVSTRPGINTSDSDLHMLKRISLHQGAAPDRASLLAKLSTLI